MIKICLFIFILVDGGATSENCTSYGEMNIECGGVYSSSVPKHRKQSSRLWLDNFTVPLSIKSHAHGEFLLEQSNLKENMASRNRTTNHIYSVHSKKETITTCDFIDIKRLIVSKNPTHFNRSSLVFHESIHRLSDYEEEENSLKDLLLSIVETEMKDCVLTIAFAEEFKGSRVLEGLLELQNSRQLVKVSTTLDFEEIEWEASQCRGYIFLLRRVTDLRDFVERNYYEWDFQGRYILVGLLKEQLEMLMLAKKFTKTESVIGIVKYPRVGEWGVYTNQVIVGSGLSKVTTWKGNGFTSLSTLFTDKLVNLQGTALRVITFQWEPSVMYRHSAEDGSLDPYGRDVMVVRGLAEALNATLIFNEVSPGEVWGTPSENGSWNGLMGYLQRGEADVGIANMFITNINDRNHIVDFSAPFDIEVSCFLSRKPKPLPQWERILYPFQLQTWLAMLLGLIASGPILSLLSRANYASGGELMYLNGLSNASLYTFGIQFKVAQHLLPIRRSTQVLVSFLWLYAIIITTGYNSNLTAFLTVARQPPTIDTIRELHEAELEVAGMGIFFGSALASSKNPYLRALSSQYKPYSRHADIWHGVKKGDAVYIEGQRYLLYALSSQYKPYSRHADIWHGVKKGDAVYIEGQRYLLYVIGTKFSHRGVSTMRIIKETFSPYGIGLTTQRSSPLKRKFDVLINWMVEGGLVNYWFLESLRIAGQQEADEKRNAQDAKADIEDPEILDIEVQSGVRPLNLSDVQGIFFSLVLGCLVASLCLATEVTVGKRL